MLLGCKEACPGLCTTLQVFMASLHSYSKLKTRDVAYSLGYPADQRAFATSYIYTHPTAS
ncbi:hypothetical protein PHLCEN_2v8311 [Hermanssonia centrifuga]|uniref:Uncharacterized protein n=1 Tax=Hermanssonia centrifuga TaxID=98765 RepID=A0A2R6NU75_9APHY|nr:hypothetical protein PHLCEN_2v8311 [Hermanssonia centrifuga]